MFDVALGATEMTLSDSDRVSRAWFTSKSVSAARSHTARALPVRDNRHRVFAVGDVRSGSVKRVASAVGEGSVCVQLVLRALAQ